MDAIHVDRRCASLFAVSFHRRKRIADPDVNDPLGIKKSFLDAVHEHAAMVQVGAVEGLGHIEVGIEMDEAQRRFPPECFHDRIRDRVVASGHDRRDPAVNKLLKKCQAFVRHFLKVERARDEFVLDASTFCQAGFTVREAEVAYWLTEGKTNAEIAALMKVQVQTGKGYLTALFDKSGTGNRLALTLHLLELARTVLRREKPFKLVPVRSWTGKLHDPGCRN